MNLFKILDGTPEPPIIDLHLPVVNDGGDYTLATPMYDFQKELTDQIVSLHYPDILKYCELQDLRDIIVKLLEICISNCMAVLTHPYLLIDHYMPKNLYVRDMPAKLAETSGKFNVLKDLINVIIDCSSGSQQLPAKKHIGVVMNNHQRQFDLVEALLVGGCTAKKNVKRYVGNPNKNNKPLPQALTVIHLVPGDGNVTREAESLSQVKFDVLIVFDGNVDTSHPSFTQLRQQNRRGEAVVIRLVPMRTIEHIKQFYHNHDPHDNKDKLYRLISSIVCLRDHIGTLPPDTVPIYNQHLTYLAKPFFDDVFRSQARLTSFPPWPLPELPPIPKFSCSDVERSLLTEVHFHYTPYDTNGDDNEETVHEQVPTYYETKRLQLDYVTNPLKNDYDKLIGIHLNVLVGGHGTDNTKFTPNLLTHKLILQLNNAINDYQAVTDEVKVYEDYASDKQQLRHGRRQRELDQTLASINIDMDHAESRINVATKKLASRQDEIDQFKRDIANSKQAVETFLDNELTLTVKSEKTEAKNLQVIKVEAVKLEDTKLEAINLEDTKLEAVNLEDAKLEDIELEDVKPEAVKLEAVKLEDKPNKVVELKDEPTNVVDDSMDIDGDDIKKVDDITNSEGAKDDVSKAEGDPLISNGVVSTTSPEPKGVVSTTSPESKEGESSISAPVEATLDDTHPESTEGNNSQKDGEPKVDGADKSNQTNEPETSEQATKLEKSDKLGDDLDHHDDKLEDNSEDKSEQKSEDQSDDQLKDQPEDQPKDQLKREKDEASTPSVAKPERTEDDMDVDDSSSTTVVLSEGQPVATIINDDKSTELIPNGTNKSTFTEFYHNQLQIWELQAKIKETIEKITSRSEEKSYIAKEVENCKKSMADSEAEIATVKEAIALEKQKLKLVREQEAESRKRFHSEMLEMDTATKNEKTNNDEMRLHLAESLRFLRSTPYMKKRKGRTPNK